MAEPHRLPSQNLAFSSEWEASPLQSHFLVRLRAAEASLKHSNPVKRLTASTTAAEFGLTCRGFHSEPVVMPADWLPPWTNILQAPCVTEGLEGLLGDEVEVEVFRLDFRTDSRIADSAVASTVKSASCDVGTKEAEDAATIKMASCIVGTKEAEAGAAGVAKKRKCVDGAGVTAREYAVESCETPAPSSTAAMAAADMHAASEPSIKETCAIREAARLICAVSAPEAQPAPALQFSYLPHSSVHLMSLGRLLSTCRGPSSQPSKSSEPPLPAWQLMYLTWRGLPQSSTSMQPDVERTSTEISRESLSNSNLQEGKSQKGCQSSEALGFLKSEENTAQGFSVFIDQLLAPTLSPPFLNALRRSGAGGREQWNLWVGRSATSQIHFDGMDNVHVCLQGSKIVHLYSPSDSIFLYPMPWSEGSINNKSSLPSILTACPDKHPLFFSHVTCYRVQLMQGEAIFIPAGWWHEVFTFGPMTVSANVWFPPHPSCRLRPTLMMLHSHRILQHMQAAWRESSHQAPSCEQQNLKHAHEC